MGQQHSHGKLGAEEKRIARKYSNKFSEGEIASLYRIFWDLARRSPNKTMDPEHFDEYIGFPGLHGTQVFKAFDKKKNGVLDFEEFLSGLARSARGSKAEKVKFLFEIYDLKGDGYVWKSELRSLLNHVPKSALREHKEAVAYKGKTDGIRDHRFAGQRPSVEEVPPATDLIEAPVARVPGATHRFYQKTEAAPYKATYSGSFLDEYTNDDMVEEAFQRCDLNDDGKLEFPEFKILVDNFPEVLEFLDHVFEKAMRLADPAASSGAMTGPKKPHKPIRRPSAEKATRRPSAEPPSRRPSSDSNSPSSLNTPVASERHYSMSDKSSIPKPKAIPDRLFPRNRSDNTLDDTIDTDDSIHSGSSGWYAVGDPNQYEDDAENQDALHHEGYLLKKGAKTHKTFKRYFALVGKCLYYFHRRSDTKPKGLIFLGGCQVEKLSSAEASGGNGFRIVHLDSERLGQRQHVLYANSETERDAWVEALLLATSAGGGKSGSFDVGQYYDFESELGTGRFAIARQAVDKKTKSKVAIKSIEKRHSLLSEVAPAQSQQRELQPNSDPDQPPVILDPAQSKNERDMFRREIAVMRLAQHKYVLPLVTVFEDRSHVHLVMPLMSQDLGQYLIHRYQNDDQCTEKDARICMPVIIEAVAYLHHMGIFHRDLKPDNILMEDPQDLTRLRLADFSISQILKPGDTINKPAGSLEYMAPEVFLKHLGASYPADVWAVGVIGLIVLFFKQPFAGDTKGETIGNIIDHELVPDYDWTACTSECHDLFLLQMLEHDPAKRISAQKALETHPWLEHWREQHSDSIHTLDHDDNEDDDPNSPRPESSQHSPASSF